MFVGRQPKLHEQRVNVKPAPHDASAATTRSLGNPGNPSNPAGAGGSSAVQWSAAGLVWARGAGATDVALGGPSSADATENRPKLTSPASNTCINARGSACKRFFVFMISPVGVNPIPGECGASGAGRRFFAAG